MSIPVAMIHIAPAQARCAPPSSFFIQTHRTRRFQVQPAAYSKSRRLLPTKCSVLCPLLPQFISIRRGARSAARPTVLDQGKVLGSRSSPVIHSVMRARVSVGSCAPRLQIGRPHIGGRRV